MEDKIVEIARFYELGISKEDMMMYYTDASVYNMPLTENEHGIVLRTP